MERYKCKNRNSERGNAWKQIADTLILILTENISLVLYVDSACCLSIAKSKKRRVS